MRRIKWVQISSVAVTTPTRGHKALTENKDFSRSDRSGLKWCSTSSMSSSILVTRGHFYCRSPVIQTAGVQIFAFDLFVLSKKPKKCVLLLKNVILKMIKYESFRPQGLFRSTTSCCLVVSGYSVFSIPPP